MRSVTTSVVVDCTIPPPNHILPIMTSKNIKQELVDRRCLNFSGQGGVPRCQWVGTSGAHLDGYFCLDPASPDTRFMRRLARELVAPFTGQGIRAVVTPAIGSISLGAFAADALMEADGAGTVWSLWADKLETGAIAKNFGLIRPTFASRVQGMNTLIVEDIINRRYTATKVKECVQQAGGVVVGMATAVALQDVHAANLGVPRLHALCNIAYNSWAPEQCAQEGPCSRNEPFVVDEGLGHGDAYQQKHPLYGGGFIKLLQ